MKNFYSLFSLINLFLLSLFVACSTEDYVSVLGQIEGIVKNAKTNEPISGCEVISNNIGTKLTDENGRYSFNDVEPGTITLTYKATGYEPTTREIKVSSGTVTADVSLQPIEETTSIYPDKTTLDFGSRTGVLNLILTNPGSTSVQYNIKSEANWITADPDHGTILAKNESTIKVSVNRDEISDGSYEKILTIETSSGKIEIQILVDKGSNIRPSVNTLSVSQSNETSSSVNAEGAITVIGSSSILQHGFCYAIGKEPTINEYDGITNLGDASTPQNFSSIIRNLELEKEYYIRAYATNESGTGYGETLTIILHNNTQEYSVVTLAASDITNNSAILNANITGDVITSLKSYGFYFGETPACSNKLDNNINIIGDDVISGTLNNLSPDTEYYFKAFIENDKGIKYGDVKTFITSKNSSSDSDLDLITKEATEITTNSAILNGAFGGNKSFKIKEYGFFYGTTSNPSLRIIKQSFASAVLMGLESFSVKVTDLKEDTRYYFQSYAIDENNNISKGPLSEFTTKVTPRIEINSISLKAIDEFYNFVLSGEATLYPQGNSIIEAGFLYRADGYDLSYNSGQVIQCEIINDKISVSKEIKLPAGNYFIYYRAYMILADGTIIYNGPKKYLEPSRY